MPSYVSSKEVARQGNLPIGEAAAVNVQDPEYNRQTIFWSPREFQIELFYLLARLEWWKTSVGTGSTAEGITQPTLQRKIKDHLQISPDVIGNLVRVNVCENMKFHEGAQVPPVSNTYTATSWLRVIDLLRSELQLPNLLLGLSPATSTVLACFLCCPHLTVPNWWNISENIT